MIYRSEKGSPLTFEEVDGNFKELYSMIKILEQNQERERALPAEVIKEIKQEGEELYFVGNYGSDFGHVILPKIMPNPRGKWQKDEFYTVSDWVIFDHKTYACIKTHVAHAFEGEQDNWRLVIDPKPESVALQNL